MRMCLDCGNDISQRGPAAKRCQGCGASARRAQTRIASWRYRNKKRREKERQR